MATTLFYKPLLKEGRLNRYSTVPEEIITNQCSTIQIYNFKYLNSFKQFRRELREVMDLDGGWRLGVCVVYRSGWFWLLKLWFWRWCVQRIGFTGGSGTLWIIRKRIWIA